MKLRYIESIDKTCTLVFIGNEYMGLLKVLETGAVVFVPAQSGIRKYSYTIGEDGWVQTNWKSLEEACQGIEEQLFIDKL